MESTESDFTALVMMFNGDPEFDIFSERNESCFANLKLPEEVIDASIQYAKEDLMLSELYQINKSTLENNYIGSSQFEHDHEKYSSVLGTTIFTACVFFLLRSYLKLSYTKDQGIIIEFEHKPPNDNQILTDLYEITVHWVKKMISRSDSSESLTSDTKIEKDIENETNS